jgi:ATP synthase protein I
MTQAQGPEPQPTSPFAALRGAGVTPMIATVPVIVLVFWLTRQSAGGLAALLGAVIAIAFFTSGLYVVSRVANANPLASLPVALAVYFAQVIFLGVVIVSLSGADWLDHQAFGLSVLAVALIWQLSQVLAFRKLRKPVYDEPGDTSAGGLAARSADRPTL